MRAGGAEKDPGKSILVILTREEGEPADVQGKSLLLAE